MRHLSPIAALLAASLCVGCSPVAADAADEWQVWEKNASAEMLALLHEQVKASRGEAADLDGDGVRETTAFRAADGTMKWESDVNQDGWPDWTLEQLPNGDAVSRFDTVRNGKWLEILDEEREEGRLHIVSSDSQGRGSFDERRTERLSDDGQSWDVVTEHDGTGTGQWSPVAHFSVPANLLQGAGGCATYPEPQDSKESLDSLPRISIVTSGPAACNSNQATEVAISVECAYGLDAPNQGLGCLEKVNRQVASALKALSTKKRITIGCGHGCPGEGGEEMGAGTRSPFINLNPDEVDLMTTSERCAVVLHELLHAARVPVGPKHNEGDATDRVYACGNYCGGCVHLGKTQPLPTTNEDCARCAGTPSERAACGEQVLLVGMPCLSDALCHGSIGTNLACETCKGTQRADCAGGVLYAPKFYCCQTCPSNASRMNDVECTPPVPSSVGIGTCTQELPACKR